MVYLDSVIENLEDEAVRILVLMQEGDEREGFTNLEWAAVMYDAHELVKKAVNKLREAATLDI